MLHAEKPANLTGHREMEKTVEVLDRSTPFQGYFSVVRYVFRHALFGGGMSDALTREVFERGHAAAVLPYDPGRDQVVLIEQFRPGAYAAGQDPWLVEIVAGIIEDGETPEDVARRELYEEAGLAAALLEPVGTYLVSPGGSSETMALFCARIDAATAGGVHGHRGEGEDILVRALPFDEALQALYDNVIASFSAVIALQWLALNREDLRRRWQG